MQVDILHYTEGAENARGSTVVIDVFRAFSVACYVMQNNAREIIAVGNVETAFDLKRKNPGWLLMGERNERKVEGFDFGNSPAHIERVDFTGRTVVQTTSAGTRGLVLARAADEVLTGSFVNANAVISYLRSKKPEFISLVAMGYGGKNPTDEDQFCAEYIRNSLLNKPTDLGTMMQGLKEGSGRRFFDPINLEHSPPRDFDLCTRVGVFHFILKADRINMESVILKKEMIPGD